MNENNIYPVEISRGIYYNNVREIYDWILENCTEKYNFTSNEFCQTAREKIIFNFNNEHDAMIFKLRWS